MCPRHRHQFDPQSGVLLQNFRQDMGEHRIPEPVRRPDPHDTGNFLGRPAKAVAQSQRIPLHLAGMGQNALSDIRQQHAFFAALEDRGADGALQPFDVAGDRGVTDPQAPRGQGHAPCPLGLQKIANVFPIELHERP